MATLQAKIGWKKMRKGENKNYRSVSFQNSLVILLFLKRTLKLIKLSLWRSNNQTYHL